MTIAYEPHPSTSASCTAALRSFTRVQFSSDPVLRVQPSTTQKNASHPTSTCARRSSLLTLLLQNLSRITSAQPAVYLPAAAFLLVWLNHSRAVFRLLYALGFVDCIALLCLLLGATLAIRQLVARSRQAARCLMIQVIDMVDSKALLAKVTDIAQSDPAPSRWLEMYCNMVDNISGLLKENVKMRTIMAGMQADIDHLKSKGKYIHPIRTMYRSVAGTSKNQPET